MKTLLKKPLLLAGLLLGLTPLAQAQDAAETYNFKVGGKVRAFYGQYNPGTEGVNPRLTEFDEANLFGQVERGPVTAYFEIESRSNQFAYAYQRRVEANLGLVKLSIGTQVPKESYAFAADAGTATSESSRYGFYKGLLLKTELDGLRLETNAAGITLGLTSYSADALNTSSSYLVTGKPGEVSGTASTVPTSSEGTVKTPKAGSATQVGAAGAIGPVEFRASLVNSVTDDHRTDYDKLNHGGSQFGLKGEVAEGLSWSLDAASKTLAQDANFNKVYDDKALQVIYRTSGGQGITLTWGAESYQDEKYAGTKENDTSTSTFNLVYQLPLAKDADLRFLVASQAVKSEADGGDTVTASFAGLGLQAKF